MPRRPTLTLDQKIERAEAEVARTKQRYESAVAALEQLMELRDEGKRQELFKALAQSNRSYAEIMAFIRSDPENDEAAG